MVCGSHFQCKFPTYKDLRYIKHSPVLLICMLLLLSNTSLGAEEIDHQARAYRTAVKIKVDGVLDEADWGRAKPITKFFQVQPNEGEPITQPTEVRILYDDKNIYFGYTCYDSDMHKLILNEMRRDAHGLYSNDHGFLLLDPYNARRSAVFFRFNAIGGIEDAAVSNCGDSRNDSWDIVWKCHGKVNDDNWTVEIAIPFNQLRFGKSDVMTWGMNLGRQVARNDEIATWCPVPKSYGPMAKYRTAYFGDLIGLEGISPSRHLELLPYLSGGVERMEGENDGTYDAGLDAKYSITTNLTADVTLNTDFAQVEADQEQVNLTRFSLFFPEKRPFFMEGASLFDFGVPRPSFRRPPPLLLFYSRSIGLVEGYAIPIIAGAKLTGKVSNRFGQYGVGLLNVTTDEYHNEEVEEDEEPIHELRTNYTVLRLKRDVLSGSSIGVMAINEQDSDNYNRSAGLDFSFRPGKKLDINGLWARTFEEGVTGQNNAFYLGGNWQSDPFRLSGSYTDIGEFFNPAVGFIRREDIRHIRASAQYSSWPRKFGIRSIDIGPEFEVVYTRDNELATRDVSLDSDFELEAGGSIGFNLQHIEDNLEEEFEIREDVFIPVGEYKFPEFRASYRTDGNRKVSGSFSANFGDFYGGERRGFGIDVNVKPNARLSVESMFDFNRIILPQDTFNASIFGSRVSYSFSTKLFAKLFAQWNSDREALSANFLINYIYRPGSDFYLVVNQSYETEDETLHHQETTIIGKITYWWSL
ncbi:DUF5916 domain-containing protein [Candidatus Poribacteria bacterium]